MMTDRPLSFEWNGISKFTFNQANKFFITQDFWNSELAKRTLVEEITFRHKHQVAISRNMQEFWPDGSCIFITVNKTDKNLLSIKHWASLIGLYYTSKNDFNQKIAKYTSITFENMCPSELVKRIKE